MISLHSWHSVSPYMVFLLFAPAGSRIFGAEHHIFILDSSEPRPCALAVPTSRLSLGSSDGIPGRHRLPAKPPLGFRRNMVAGTGGAGRPHKNRICMLPAPAKRMLPSALQVRPSSRLDSFCSPSIRPRLPASGALSRRPDVREFRLVLQARQGEN